MTNREKVIKGLECCTREDIGACNNCPYNENTPYCDIDMMREAIVALKAQEPVKPIRDINGVYYCGICDTICVGYEVEFTNSIIKVENYCHKCGRKVKWDG